MAIKSKSDEAETAVLGAPPKSARDIREIARNRIHPLRAFDFNISNLASVLIVMVLTVFFEVLHYQEKQEFDAERLLLVALACTGLLLFFQGINYWVIARDSSLIGDLMSRLDSTSAELDRAKTDYELTKDFYKRSDELICQFVANRDAYEQKVLQTIYNISYLAPDKRVKEFDGMTSATNDILNNLCATTCAVISLRKYQNTIRFSANIKCIFQANEGDESSDLCYGVIARSTPANLLRGRIDKVNGRERKVSENYFFTQLFNPYNSTEMIFHDVEKYVAQLGPEFREPNGRTKEVYSHCLMTKIVGDPLIGSEVIGNPSLKEVEIVRAGNRRYYPDVRDNVLGILTVDSDELTFDQEYDISIVR